MSVWKHTPGPWEVTFDGKDFLVGPCCNAPRIAIIRTCRSRWPVDHEVPKGNAQLIAAAPDLLEACQYALQILLSKEKYSNDDALWSCVSHFTRALSKAKGAA